MSRKTIPRETEKPKKLTRAQKKEIDAVIRKYKGDGKPRTAQATIPYEAIYPDGVCRIDRRTFSKCIAFEDISYQLAQPETRTAIFEHLCDLYNYVDASIHVQLSFLNRKVDPVQYAKSFEIAPQGDDFDDIRAEYTAILQKQLASGNNGIVKTKYLTFTIDADSLKTARARLTRIGLDLLGYFKTMGCVAHVMDGRERLEVLHGIFHPDGEPFRFDWDWLAPSGLSTKDFVAPSSLCFGTAKTFGLGGKYGAVSFLQILAPELSDEMLADFLKTESGILVNLHVQAIDQTEAIKTIKRKITDLDAMKIQEQKKAVRSGYDMDILPSDLATYGEDAKKLLNKLQTRNERLFMLTFLVLNVADTKQKLGNDVFQAAGVAQKYNCSLVRLDYQQEQGLVSSLPLGINQIKIQRSLTTSNVAVFVPFVTQELFQSGAAMYYGINAKSHNMIMLDRKQARCPNGLKLGTPGSGKSMFCCILAKALTRDKRKAIIINADMNVPMLPVWLPEQIIQTNTSIGQVLSSVEIDTSLVASHVTVLKNYPFIGMMGYAAGENPLSYPEVKYTMVLQLIHAAAKLVDFVILDCSSNMTNVFTPAAIESGDLVIRILTPDLKGINYLKAHQPLLVDERFRFSEHMTFAGLARPFHALDEMGYIIGGFDGLLPYSKEIDRCATEGGMFKAITYCNPKYTASLNKVLEILEQMELAEQSEEDAAYECEEDADE